MIAPDSQLFSVVVEGVESVNWIGIEIQILETKKSHHIDISAVMWYSTDRT